MGSVYGKLPPSLPPPLIDLDSLSRRHIVEVLGHYHPLENHAIRTCGLAANPDLDPFPMLSNGGVPPSLPLPLINSDVFPPRHIVHALGPHHLTKFQTFCAYGVAANPVERELFSPE
jgi:hypothetical protein